MLFIDYSSAFNTIVPSKLNSKLGTFGTEPLPCNWILNFLTGRPQVVRVGNNTSAMLTLNTVCAYSPPVLLIHPQLRGRAQLQHHHQICSAVVGLITDHDESAYKDEVRDLAVWCQDNNLSLNIIKTKELIVDYMRNRGEHAPILINRAVVERVKNFKFLGVHITKDLTWSTYTPHSREAGTAAPLPPQEAEKIGHEPSDP